MSTIYAVGGYIISNNEDFSLAIDQVFTRFVTNKFNKDSDLTLFPDEESAKEYQLTTFVQDAILGVKQWQVLFEVELNNGAEGPYIDKLIKASIMTTSGIPVEYNLNSLPVTKYLLSNTDRDRLKTFILCREDMGMPKELYGKILDNYYQLAFFQKQPQQPKVNTGLVEVAFCTIL